MQDNWTLFSYEQYKQFRDHSSGFAELAALQAGQSLIGVRRNGSNNPSESYKSGSAQQSVKVCILRGFLKDDEFGSGNYHALCFQQEIAEILVAASSS
jgi:hypothetical protein